MIRIKQEMPERCDALVIGLGAAGLTFALPVKDIKPELSVHVVETTQSIGGVNLILS